MKTPSAFKRLLRWICVVWLCLAIIALYALSRIDIAATFIGFACFAFGMFFQIARDMLFWEE